MLGPPPTMKKSNDSDKPKPINSYKLPRDIGPGLLKFCLTHTDSPNLKESTPVDRDPKDYEWLRQAFDNLEDDAKRMQKINDILKDSSSSDLQILTSLEKLQFFIEDLDNSGDYIKIGGIPILVELIKSENQDIRAQAINCLTIITQNEETIQQYLLAIGVLDLAIHNLSKEVNPLCREKLLSLISSLISTVDNTQHRIPLEKIELITRSCVSFLSPTVDLIINDQVHSVNNSVSGMIKATHILTKIIKQYPVLKSKGIEFGIIDGLVNLIYAYNNHCEQQQQQHLDHQGKEIDNHLNNNIVIMCEKAELGLLELITNNNENKQEAINLFVLPELEQRQKSLKALKKPTENEQELNILNQLLLKLK